MSARAHGRHLKNLKHFLDTGRAIWLCLFLLPRWAATIPSTFTLQEAIMQEVIDWIDKEVERLDREMKGDGENPVPELVQAALKDCV